MKASSKTNQTLLKELEYLRQVVADLERRESERKQADEILQILTELVNIAPGEASFEVSHFRKDGSILPLSVQTRI
jgi:hypothetical protein